MRWLVLNLMLLISGIRILGLNLTAPTMRDEISTIIFDVASMMSRLGDMIKYLSK